MTKRKRTLGSTTTKFRLTKSDERMWNSPRRDKRFTLSEEKEAKRIAKEYQGYGYTKKQATKIGYATIVLHKKGVKT